MGTLLDGAVVSANRALSVARAADEAVLRLGAGFQVLGREELAQYARACRDCAEAHAAAVAAVASLSSMIDLTTGEASRSAE